MERSRHPAKCHEGPLRAISGFMGPNRSPLPINRRLEPNRRLDSWKEIAAFLGYGERTVKRWENERGLPVHRMPGAGRGRVFAYSAELASWMDTGGGGCASEEVSDLAEPVESSQPEPRRRLRTRLLTTAVLCLALGALALVLYGRHRSASEEHSVRSGAEDLYLQGRFYWNKRTPESLRTAVDYFAQAIVRDPNYAQAYVGLADCYNLLREFSAMPASEAYPKALDAARRAVQLDDRLAEAHNSLAFVSFYWNWDAATADREFQRAIQLNPNFALAHHWRANFLMVMRRLPEAMQEIELARKLDPASNAILADKGLLLKAMGRYREALALLEQIEAEEPRFSSAHFYLAEVHLEMKDDQGYLAEMRQAFSLTQDSQGLAVVAAGEKGLAQNGHAGMFEGILVTQQELYSKGQLPAYALAQTYGRLGRKQPTLEWLRTSLGRAEPALVALRNDPSLECVMGDPAYQDIVRSFDLGARH
jgi:tetratricopeptide (TPR) repeat protein